MFLPAKIKQDVIVEVLDVPSLHSYSEKASTDFYNALAESEDLQLFGNRSIKAIIDFKWPLAQLFTVYYLFGPFILY